MEAKEEVIENWWFQHYAKGVDTDLNSYLCVKRMKGLCFIMSVVCLIISLCLTMSHADASTHRAIDNGDINTVACLNIVSNDVKKTFFQEQDQ